MEEPNLGVARALVVILILHVAAIIAIVVHSSASDNNKVITAKATPREGVGQTRAVAVANQAAKPKISADDKVEYVQQGDTYERFARRHGVDVQELRRLNNSTPLLYGMPLIVPRPAAPNYPGQRPAMVNRDEIIRESLPPIQNAPARNVPVRSTMPLEYEIVEEAQPIEVIPNPFPDTPALADQRPAEIRTTTALQEIIPLPVPEVEAALAVVPEVQPAPQPAPKPKPQVAPKPSAKSYTIRKGDTLWAIANRNGISVDKLMAANRGVNPKALRPGKTKIKIPTR